MDRYFLSTENYKTGLLIDFNKDPDGEWVKYSDVQQLEKKLQELEYKQKKAPNPICDQCQEPDCLVSSDGTCAWTRRAAGLEKEMEVVKGVVASEVKRIYDSFLYNKAIPWSIIVENLRSLCRKF